MKPMNPLTAKPHLFETVLQMIFAVHHGNSLVYAFVEVSTVLIFCMQIFVLTKQQTGLV